MKQVYLICEGEANSLDSRLLKRFFARQSVYALIESSGGDAQLGSIATYIEKREMLSSVDKKTQPIVFTIRDRNYDDLVTCRESWNKGRTLVWCKHEIENYLLEPKVVSQGLKRFDSRFADLVFTKNLLDIISQQFIEAHAGKLTFHKFQKKRLGFDLRLELPKGVSSKTTRDYWIGLIRGEFRKLNNAAKLLSASNAFDEQTVETEYDLELNTLRSSHFFENEMHLNDLEGKELLSALIDHFNKDTGKNVERDDFEEYLISGFVDSYDASNSELHDFGKLEKRLKGE